MRSMLRSIERSKLYTQGEPEPFLATIALAPLVQVLERDPGSLQPHFGTAAVAEALQPLRAWAGRQGLDFGSDLSAVAGGDTARLRQVAGAALQSGAHSLEVGCVRIWPLAPRVTVYGQTISPAPG